MTRVISTRRGLRRQEGHELLVRHPEPLPEAAQGVRGLQTALVALEVLQHRQLEADGGERLLHGGRRLLGRLLGLQRRLLRLHEVLARVLDQS